MSNHKSWAIRALGGLVVLALAALSSTSGARAQTNNLGLPVIPLTIQNNSNLKKTLYVYIAGMSGPTWYYVSDMNGNVTPFTVTTTPKPFGINAGKGDKIAMKLPQLQAMRIYFSFGKRVNLTVSSSGVPGVPAGWASGDPNYDTLFDWTEFTWVPDGGGKSTLGGNATQVDMFGFATRIRLAGKDDDYTTPVVKTSGFQKAKSRQQIFDALNAAKQPWKKLIIGKANNPLRAIAPYHGMIAGTFPADQLNGYINKVWKQYQTDEMTAKPQNIPYVGKVAGGKLVFARKNNPAITFSFPKPTGRQVYEGAILPVPIPADPLVEQQARAIGALLQGAFMRSTLLVNGNLEACKKNQFYKNDPVNEYAKAIHAPSIDELAYAFGYDDTCSQSSYIGVHNPTSMVLTILPM